MELLLTKLQPPQEQPDFLNRPRLFAVCPDLSRQKIISVTAPAGYGKTVLLLQLCRQMARPHLWYQLDQYDNDPSTFLNYLAAGLRIHNSEAGEKVETLSYLPGVMEKNLRFAVTAFINGLKFLEHGLTIVLDDYHWIEENTVHGFLQQIVDNLPENVCIALASRQEIPLSLSRLQVSDRVLALDAEKICFTPQEVSLFLTSDTLKPAKQIIDQIITITEGWPAAVRLARGLQGSDIAPFTELWKDNVNKIYSYLAAEVFERQPQLIQDFLVTTSVLDILAPESCNELLGRSDSAGILETLCRQQLFINPLSGGSTYCYHQLFKEFLQKLLGEERKSLLLQAGRQAMNRGEMKRAVNYLLQTEFSSELAAVLKRVCREALDKGQWQIVFRWLNKLANEEILSDPWLSLYKAQIEVHAGRLSEAEPWVVAAEDGMEITGDKTGLRECAILRAHLHRSAGKYQESLNWLMQIHNSLSQEEASKYFTLPLEIAYSQMLIGKMADAEKTLDSALSVAKAAENVFLIATIAEALGNVLYLQGKYARAVQIYQWSMNLLPEHNLPGYFIQDLLAYIYKDWGELDKALEYARRSVEAKERIGLTESLPSAYSALAYVLFELERYEEVESYSRKVIEILTNFGGERYFLYLNKLSLAWSVFHLGRWVEARQIIQNTLMDIKNNPDTASALCKMMAGTVYAQMGYIQEAQPLLLESVARLDQIGYATRVCDGYKALAWVFFTQKDQKQFQCYAKKYLELAASLNYLCCFLRPTAVLLQPILSFGLEHGVETVFTQRIIVQMGEGSIPLLENLILHPNPEVRCRLIPPLVEIGGSRSQAALAALLEDGDPAVQRTARLTSEHPESSMITTPELMIKTLGAFQVTIKGKEIPGWRTQKTRDLLAYLTHLEDPVSREVITEELWPGYHEDKAFALFRTTLYYLRTALTTDGSSDIILFSNGRYALRREVVSQDCREFEQSITRILNKDFVTKADIFQLEKMTSLYKGKYLEDLDYLWVIPKQVRMSRLYIDALMCIARFYLDKKKQGKAISCLLKVIEAEPYSEQAYRLLMHAYADMGNLWEVKRTYHNLKKALADELGVSPSPETTEYYKLVCRQN